MMISFCVCFINTAENNCRCMPNSTNVIQLSKKEKNSTIARRTDQQFIKFIFKRQQIINLFVIGHFLNHPKTLDVCAHCALQKPSLFINVCNITSLLIYLLLRCFESVCYSSYSENLQKLCHCHYFLH